MKNFWKRTVSTLLVLTLIVGLIVGATASAENSTLSAEQRNAIAMLNHLTVLTQETNASKNSRLFMEQAYSSLINNTYPNSVDSRTLNQMTGLLDTMERYRMISVKRDRLQFIYEQNQAQAIRAAMPNPIGLLSSVHSLTPARLVASIVYMAVDSYTSYTAYTAEADLQAVKDGWELDDEEAAVLHDSRKSTFSYMVKMVNDYNLPGELALTESTVEDFVRWKNEPNVVARIQFLDSNKSIYQSYGGYWLELVDSYYNNNELQKCLEALEQYESMGTRIFRWDFDYAKILPLAIAAASEVYPDEEYEAFASKRAEAIMQNTTASDWALRYFAAQTFVELAGRTGKKEYLQRAYDITLDNVNSLMKEQQDKNSAYLVAVKETAVPKDATNSQKDQINKYNQALKEERKTEFPPVSEPLALNCDLLFALAKELDITEAEQAKVETILHPSGAPLFLTNVIDEPYWFSEKAIIPDAEIPIEFNGTGLAMPVPYIAKDCAITVSVKEKSADEPVAISDWKLYEVKRGTEGDINTFIALFSSEEAKQHVWEPESAIIISIKPQPDKEKTYTFEYTAEGTKKEWYDYLKFWEGHKNEWYDYLKVWDNSVNFIRVGVE